MAKFITFKPDESEKLNENEPVLKYKLLTSKAYPPTRETAGSIGYDLSSPRFARILPKGGTYYLPLGIAFQIPKGHYGRLAPKSGLAIYRSIGVLAGVIDQDQDMPSESPSCLRTSNWPEGSAAKELELPKQTKITVLSGPPIPPKGDNLKSYPLNV